MDTNCGPPSVSGKSWPRPHDGAGHPRTKQRTVMANREKARCPVNPVFCPLNMDGQDKQDDTLRHRKQNRSMIGCRFEVIH